LRNEDDLLRQYRKMMVIRRFEEEAARNYAKGKIGGFLHLYIGQEAIAVAAAEVLEESDYIFQTYRDHGIALACGMSSNAAMAELFGKDTGCSRGLGGSMHAFFPPFGIMPNNAIVGGSAVDESTGTVTIRASVPNPDGLLLPGMFVRVRLQQGVVPEGILAPQQGISRDPTGRATALVLGENDKVESREVEADRAIGDKWLVTGGLKAGDRLIVEGTDKVRPGQLVKPVAVSLAKAK